MKHHRQTSSVMVFAMLFACTYRERITVKPNRADGDACVSACVRSAGDEDQIFECASRCPGIERVEARCDNVSPSCYPVHCSLNPPCIDRARTDVVGTVGAFAVVILGGVILVAGISAAVPYLIGGNPCVAVGTLIATPTGEVPIERLTRGDVVMSMHRGRLQAVPLRAVSRTAVARDHAMVEIALASGRTVAMSPGHPTADGRTFGELAANAVLGDARVVAVRRIPYLASFTYDILPDSDTGTYVAAGALVGSTMTAAGAPRAIWLEPRP